MSIELPGRRQAASEAVVEAVSDKEGVDPAELDRPLYEAIDPEGLDSLTEGGSGEMPVYVTFRYYGYHVTVSSAGDVTLGE
jgi:hypothetical protein